MIFHFSYDYSFFVSTYTGPSWSEPPSRVMTLPFIQYPIEMSAMVSSCFSSFNKNLYFPLSRKYKFFSLLFLLTITTPVLLNVYVSLPDSNVFPWKPFVNWQVVVLFTPLDDHCRSHQQRHEQKDDHSSSCSDSFHAHIIY